MSEETPDAMRAALAKMGEEVATYAARTYAAEGRAAEAERVAASAEGRIKRAQADAEAAISDAREGEREALREAAKAKGLHDAEVARNGQLVRDAHAAEVRAAKAEKTAMGMYDGNARDKSERLQALRDLEAMRAERDAALGINGKLKADLTTTKAELAALTAAKKETP